MWMLTPFYREVRRLGSRSFQRCEAAHTTWTTIAVPTQPGQAQDSQPGKGQDTVGARPGQPAGAARSPAQTGFQLKPQTQGVTGLGPFSARLIDWHMELVRA